MKQDRRSPTWVLDAAVVVSVAAYHLSLVLPCRRFAGADAFYHISVAKLMWAEGLFRGIRSLPLTVLGERGPDHHLLFHLLGMPFVGFEAFFGLKLAAAFFASASTCLFYLFLRLSRAPLPWLATILLLASSELYPLRASLFRAPTLAVPIVLLTVWALHQQRHRIVLALSCLLSWTYHGVLALLPVAVFSLCMTRLGQRQWQPKPAIYLAVGVVAGQIINPFFPKTFEYLFFHTLLKTGNPLNLPVGQEWLPATPGFLLGTFWPVHLVSALLVAYSLRRRPRIATDTATLLLCWLMFLAMSLRHGRFVEYWIPTAVALCAVACRDLQWRPPRLMSLGLAGLFVTLSVLNHRVAANLLDRGHRPDTLQQAAHFLRTHSSRGEIVLNLRWDQYPLLLYHNQHNRYAAGLDPYYLAYGKPEAYKVWHALAFARRQLPDLADKLRRYFVTRFVVAPHSYNTYLSKYSQLIRVFEGVDAVVWRVRAEP